MSEQVINCHSNNSLKENEEEPFINLTSIFPNIPPDVILKAMRDANCNMDQAIDNLVALGESLESEQNSSHNDVPLQLSEKEKDDIIRLMNIFPQIDEATLVQALRDNNGNFDETTNHFTTKREVDVQDDQGSQFNVSTEINISAPPMQQPLYNLAPEKNEVSEIDVHQKEVPKEGSKYADIYESSFSVMERQITQLTEQLKRKDAEIARHKQFIRELQNKCEGLRSELDKYINSHKSLVEKEEIIADKDKEIDELKQYIQDLTFNFEKSRITQVDIEDALKTYDLQDDIKKLVENLVSHVSKAVSKE